VSAIRARATEAARLGFSHILVPPDFGAPIDGVRVVEVATIGAALSRSGVVTA